jgi:hypothetical protein
MRVKLPNGHRGDLGRKLEEYVLSTLHREGRHKARVFDSVLGVSLANQGVLRQAILEAAATSEEVESHGDNGHGMVYTLRFPMGTTKGSATVVTAWIVRRGEDFPRLTTCYIL